MATGCRIGVMSMPRIMTEQKPSIVKPWQFLTWRIAVTSKTAWTTSRMSGHIRRSGKKSSKRDYDTSNDDKAATRRHDVGTWTGLIPESAPLVEDIADFWCQYHLGKPLQEWLHTS